MNGYNFTERVRKVLAMAREEAARLHHEYVGTEHVLLALAAEGEGVGATALQNLGADLDAIRDTIEEIIKKGQRGTLTGPDLPYTSRAKKVLELAMAEARELRHAYVGTEHLLLGLLREERGIAAQVLGDAGITIENVGNEVLRILGTETSPQPASAPHRSLTAYAGTGAADRWQSLPDPTRTVVAGAFATAHRRHKTRPTQADLLSALVFSQREIAAAFAARGVDVEAIIAELRQLTDEATDG
ncbi:MAG TPA: Clp protease N-terminal domain-containing protein [Gemmatimonadaceae bacterium]